MNTPKIGLQLYSVRDKMEKDAEATLRAVSEMGYDCVEFAGYFGHTAEELAAWLKRYRLTCPSVHQTPEVYDEDPKEAVAFVKALGAEYSAIPWYPKERYAEDLTGTLSYFTEVGRRLADAGLSLLYHNHDFELATVDGTPILDRIYGEIPAGLIAPEFDRIRPPTEYETVAFSFTRHELICK